VAHHRQRRFQLVGQQIDNRLRRRNEAAGLALAQDRVSKGPKPGSARDDPYRAGRSQLRRPVKGREQDDVSVVRRGVPVDVVSRLELELRTVRVGRQRLKNPRASTNVDDIAGRKA
jgi:hypothetical protein